MQKSMTAQVRCIKHPLSSPLLSGAPTKRAVARPQAPSRISIHLVACWHKGCRAVALRESLTGLDEI
jgi:hypothetical protein